MKKILLNIILLLIFSSFLLSDTEIVLNEFDGGSLNFNLTFYTDSFYGARGDALRMGGTVSTLDFHTSFTSYNPAVLAYENNPYISMSFIPVPFISSDLVNNFISDGINNSIGEAINSMYDDVFSDVTKAAGVTTDINSVKAYIGQDPAMMGVEGVIPFANNNAGIGIGREEKFTLNLNLLLNGLEGLFNITDPDNPSIDINMRIMGDVILNAEVRNVVTSVGMGRKLAPYWGVGIVVEHYESKFFVNGLGDIGGIATLAGVTKEFNTNENNSLEQKAYGSLTSDAWGLKIGSSHHFYKDTFEMGIDFSIQPELKYKGDVEVFYHKLPENIDTSDFTKTEKVEEVKEADCKIKIPSFMRIVLAWKVGPVISLNYIHYFDPFYLKFNENEAYLNMMDSFRLGFNFQGFQFGGGVTLANEGIKTNDKEEKVWYVIPTLSTGIAFNIGKNVLTEFELLAFPLPVFKTAISYKF